MDKLFLAMLTEWAEAAELNGIQGRKRMQKVVFFLKQTGCPIEADFALHHYGPYSRDLASLTDQMVSEGLLEETGGDVGAFSYRLKPSTRAMIELTKKRHTCMAGKFDAYRQQAIDLLKEDLRVLEIGSTILHFYRSCASYDWDTAITKACVFKRVSMTNEAVIRAISLARHHGGK